MKIKPDELFSKLNENASTRKKKTLELIHNACKKQAEAEIKDFSIGTIAKLIADDGGPSEQALRNKNSEDYRALIRQWAEYCKTTMKKPNKPKNAKKTATEEHILENISDPITRALVGVMMAEKKKLKRELSLLKEQTTFTIDLRPTIELTDTEKNALRNAISNEFMKYQGWTTDNYGRVKEKGFQVYKAGYVTAIQKILKVSQ